MTTTLPAVRAADPQPAPAVPVRVLPPHPSVPARVLAGLLSLVRRPSLLLAWVVVLVVLAWALAPGAFTSVDPYTGDSDATFLAPGWEHPFGTDRLGRDLFSRAVHGTGATLTATAIAVLVALSIGGLIGLVAGYFGRAVDVTAMRTIDVFLAIPSLLLAMVIVSMLGYSTRNIALAVGIASIASFARVMRAEVVRVVRTDYIEAAYGVGTSRFAVVVKHVLPNSLSSVLALAALEIGTSVLAVASLGFLGYGARRPSPSGGCSSRRAATSWASTPGSPCCPASSSRPWCCRRTGSARPSAATARSCHDHPGRAVAHGEQRPTQRPTQRCCAPPTSASPTGSRAGPSARPSPASACTSSRGSS